MLEKDMISEFLILFLTTGTLIGVGAWLNTPPTTLGASLILVGLGLVLAGTWALVSDYRRLP